MVAAGHHDPVVVTANEGRRSLRQQRPVGAVHPSGALRPATDPDAPADRARSPRRPRLPSSEAPPHHRARRQGRPPRQSSRQRAGSGRRTPRPAPTPLASPSSRVLHREPTARPGGRGRGPDSPATHAATASRRTAPPTVLNDRRAPRRRWPPLCRCRRQPGSVTAPAYLPSDLSRAPERPGSSTAQQPTSRHGATARIDGRDDHGLSACTRRVARIGGRAP